MNREIEEIKFRYHKVLMRLMKCRACFVWNVITISAVWGRGEQPQTEGFRCKRVKYKFVSFIEHCAKRGINSIFIQNI